MRVRVLGHRVPDFQPKLSPQEQVQQAVRDARWPFHKESLSPLPELASVAMWVFSLYSLSRRLLIMQTQRTGRRHT